jgi:hypothetical protein
MKQQAIHFVGLDVHQSTVVASVRDESGKVVMNATVPTEEKAIVALLRSWPRVHVAFEEGTQAQWLHDVLIDQVERVVVCNVRGKSPLAKCATMAKHHSSPKPLLTPRRPAPAHTVRTRITVRASQASRVARR